MANKIIAGRLVLGCCLIAALCLTNVSLALLANPSTANISANPGVNITINEPGFTNQPTPLSQGYFVWDAATESFHTCGSVLDASLGCDGIALGVGRVAVTVNFPGKNPEAILAGKGRAAALANYFVGNDPARWRTGLPMYAQVAYSQLYPGVDLVYQLVEGKLKSEFVIEPGADLGQIRVFYEGVRSLELESETKLKIELMTGETLEETLPYAYQENVAGRAPVEVEFRLVNGTTFGFAVRGEYDDSKPLIIDPILFYSTYLGGSDWDEGWAIAVDRLGNTFVTGITWSADFPAAPYGQRTYAGDKDVFVAKIDAAGALVYTTVLGGASGEEGNGIAVDEAGNAYVAGETFSPDFPVLNAWQPGFAGYEDAYVIKLDAEGRLVYSTFIGGTGAEEIDDIVADFIGNVYVSGEVYSDDYPLLNPWQTQVFGPGDEDGFISIFDANGQLAYSTYIGSSQRDQIFRLTVDQEGYVYGTGMTSSPEFPTVNPLQAHYGGGWEDCFAFKFDPWNNHMIYSTFLGGAGRDECWGIAVDGQGYVYITGFTLSDNFPVVNPLQSSLSGPADVVIAKLNPAGDALVYSTYLGGNDIDHGLDLALDSGGNLYITGETDSADWPVLDALQPVFGGGQMDAFLLSLDSQGVVQYSSFWGGKFDDRSGGVVVGKDWVVHVTGFTESPDLPLALPTQPQLSGQRDAFVGSWGLVPTPTPTLTPTPAPTPTPFAQSTIGSTGGTFWLGYPGHLTMLTVPPGAVSQDTLFVLAYAKYANEQGHLQGIDHFSKLSAYQGPTELDRFDLPLKLTLGFNRGPIIEGTLALYRLDANHWLTSGITTTEQSGNLLIAWIDQTGTWALLGQTYRIYLPLVLK